MAKVKGKLTEKQKKSLKNKAHLDLLQHRANWELFQKDIEALGSPSDYTNKQNYKNKVNELRSKHGVTGFRDLKSYNEQFKKRDAELLAAVSNRYIGTKVNRAGELLIGAGDMSVGSRLQPRFSKESGSSYKINPNYIERYDPSSEVSLKKEEEKKEALRIEKLEAQDNLRGNMTDSEMKMSEQGTWGPSPTWGLGDGVSINITGNQPANASQLAINKEFLDTQREDYLSKAEDPDSAYNQQTKQGNLNEGTANRKEYAISKDQYREFGAQLEQMKKMGASQQEINKRLLKIKRSPITSLGMEM